MIIKLQIVRIKEKNVLPIKCFTLKCFNMNSINKLHKLTKPKVTYKTIDFVFLTMLFSNLFIRH